MSDQTPEQKRKAANKAAERKRKSHDGKLTRRDVWVRPEITQDQIDAAVYSLSRL